MNNALDPLSFLTRNAGNESHASGSDCEWKVSVNAYDPPPTMGENPDLAQRQKFGQWFKKIMRYNHSIDVLRDYLLYDPHGSSIGKRYLSVYPALALQRDELAEV